MKRIVSLIIYTRDMYIPTTEYIHYFCYKLLGISISQECINRRSASSCFWQAAIVAAAELSSLVSQCEHAT